MSQKSRSTRRELYCTVEGAMVGFVLDSPQREISGCFLVLVRCPEGCCSLQCPETRDRDKPQCVCVCVWYKLCFCSYNQRKITSNGEDMGSDARDGGNVYTECKHKSLRIKASTECMKLSTCTFIMNLLIF